MIILFLVIGAFLLEHAPLKIISNNVFLESPQTLGSNPMQNLGASPQLEYWNDGIMDSEKMEKWDVEENCLDREVDILNK
jgi:hypothetical protein